MMKVEEVAEEDMIKGHLSQLTGESEIIEEGITVEDATLSMRVIKDEEIKKQLTGAKGRRCASTRPEKGVLPMKLISPGCLT
jgi:hypothetical protein